MNDFVAPDREEHEETVLYTESAKPAKLFIKHPDASVQEHLLLKKNTLIGNAAVCDVALDDPAASEQHGRIITVGPSYFITDLNSQNGTRVNGQFISHHQLRDQDIIQIGRTYLTFILIKEGPTIEYEQTDAVSEATTVSPNVIQTTAARSPSGKKRTVEVVRKRKGVGKFFSSPGRAVLSAFGIAFFVLIILALISSPKKKTKQASTDTPRTVTNSPGEDSSGQQADLMSRMEELRSSKKVQQMYFDAVAQFNELESRYDSVMSSPTLAEIRAIKKNYLSLQKQFEKIAAISPSYRDTVNFQQKISRKTDSLSKREFSIKTSYARRIDRLKDSGVRYYEQGDLSNAELTFKELLELAPGNATARDYMNRIANKRKSLNRRARQISELKRKLRAMRQELLVGKAAYEQGKLASAVNSWNKAEARFREISSMRSLMHTKEYSDAKDVYQKVRAYKMAVQPKLEELHEKARRFYGKGVTYESIGETAKAIEQWKHIFEFIKDPADEYYQKASAKIRKYE